MREIYNGDDHMRRVISFILVLVFCLSLACPAFAAVKSPSKPAPTPSGTNPKTGDVIMFWGLILVASGVALGAVYFVYRKKFC